MASIDNVNDIEYLNGIYVVAPASTDGSTIIEYSTDLAKWFIVDLISVLPEGSTIAGLYVLNGEFFITASGDDNAIIRSTDAVNWTMVYSAPFTTFTFLSMAYGNGVYVACSYNNQTGINQFLISSDALTWTPISVTTDKPTFEISPFHIVFDGVKFVAVYGYSPLPQDESTLTGLMISTDGETWTIYQVPYATSDGQIFQRVACDFNSTSAVVWNSGDFFSTTDITNGSSWGVVSSAIEEFGTLKFVNGDFGNSYYILGYDDSTRILRTSPDGTTWTSHTYPYYSKLMDIIYNGSNYVLLGNGNPVGSYYPVEIVQATSNFTVYTPHFAECYALTQYNGNVVAVGDYGTIMTSSDGGSSWVSIPSLVAPSIYVYYYGIAAGAGKMVTVGYTWDGNADGRIVAYSSDGITWTESDLSNISAGATYQITYGNGLFVSLVTDYNNNNSGVIITSPDGITWTERHTLQDSFDIAPISYVNSLFLMLNSAGILFSSSDGITWTETDVGTTGNPRNFVYGNGKYVGVLGNVFVESDDGTNWNVVNIDNGSNLFAIAYGNGLFIAVGDNGTILVSSDGETWDDKSQITISDNLQQVKYINGRFMIFSLYNNQYPLISSIDGDIWYIEQFPNNPNVIYDVLLISPNTYVSVGNDSLVFRKNNNTPVITPSVTPSQPLPTPSSTPSSQLGFKVGEVVSLLPTDGDTIEYINGSYDLFATENGEGAFSFQYTPALSVPDKTALLVTVMGNFVNGSGTPNGADNVGVNNMQYGGLNTTSSGSVSTGTLNGYDTYVGIFVFVLDTNTPPANDLITFDWGTFGSPSAVSVSVSMYSNVLTTSNSFAGANTTEFDGTPFGGPYTFDAGTMLVGAGSFYIDEHIGYPTFKGKDAINPNNQVDYTMIQGSPTPWWNGMYYGFTGYRLITGGSVAETIYAIQSYVVPSPTPTSTVTPTPTLTSSNTPTPTPTITPTPSIISGPGVGGGANGHGGISGGSFYTGNSWSQRVGVIDALSGIGAVTDDGNNNSESIAFGGSVQIEEASSWSVVERNGLYRVQGKIGNTYYTGVQDGPNSDLLYMSTDGVNWTSNIPTGYTSQSSGVFINDGTNLVLLYVTNNGFNVYTLWSSKWNGSSWDARVQIGPTSVIPDFVATSTGVGSIAVRNNANTRLYSTVDSGTTWVYDADIVHNSEYAHISFANDTFYVVIRDQYDKVYSAPVYATDLPQKVFDDNDLILQITSTIGDVQDLFAVNGNAIITGFTTVNDPDYWGDISIPTYMTMDGNVYTLFTLSDFIAPSLPINLDEESPTWLSNGYESITYVNGKYYALLSGFRGEILSTSDLTTVWGPTFKPSNISGATLYGAASNGSNTIVVVGDLATILYSTDYGTSWNKVTPAYNTSFGSVVYGNNKFVAVGGIGAVWYSSDGISWTDNTIDTAYLASICWGIGASKFVTVGYSGEIAYSSDGISWTTSTLDVNFNIVRWVNDRFVAVGYSASGIGPIHYSTDGITFTSPLTSTDVMRDVAYGNNTWVAVGNNDQYIEGRIIYSTDGTTWQTINITDATELTNVIYVDGKFIAVGYNYQNATIITFTSTDGITWSSPFVVVVDAASNPAAFDWNGTNYYIGAFGARNANLYTSTDAENWIADTSNNSSYINDITAFNGTTIINGAGGMVYRRVTIE